MSESILIVEDDVWLSSIWSKWLNDGGFSVRTVRDGHAAIDSCDDETPALIVLDMILPGSTAMAVLHELRSHSDFARIVIVVVSSVAIDEKALRPYGVTTVLDKGTLTPLQLVDACQEALR